MSVNLLSEVLIPDLGRLVRHGLGAPRWSERIWIDPTQCVRATSAFKRDTTGRVLGGEWDRATQPIEEIPKIAMARRHWIDGVPWEDTGAYDYMMARIAELGSLDGCRTLDDVVRRYKSLDIVFEAVKRERRLRTRAEISGRWLRERGGIFVHVGRKNEPIFGCGGCHRLVMAQVLGLGRIPAQLGVLHADALPTWRVLRNS